MGGSRGLRLGFFGGLLLRLLLLDVGVGSLEGASHDGFVRFFEVNVSHAHAPPSTLDWGEDVGLIGKKGMLLFKCELEDAAAFFLAGEGGEDAVVETEVGGSM
jgi:hypothetical protein